MRQKDAAAVRCDVCAHPAAGKNGVGGVVHVVSADEDVGQCPRAVRCAASPLPSLLSTVHRLVALGIEDGLPLLVSRCPGVSIFLFGLRVVFQIPAAWRFHFGERPSWIPKRKFVWRTLE